MQETKICQFTKITVRNEQFPQTKPAVQHNTVPVTCQDKLQGLQQAGNPE